MRQSNKMLLVFAAFLLLRSSAPLIASTHVRQSKGQNVALEKRSFYPFLGAKFAFAKLPWPRIDGAMKELPPTGLELQKWLLHYGPSIADWPPHFANAKEAAAAIAAWRTEAKHIAPAKKKLSASMSGVLLLATFDLYGHNIDEAQDVDQVLAEASRKFPTSAVPAVLIGLFAAHTSDNLATAKLNAALAKRPEGEYAALAHLALAANPQTLACRRHNAVLQFQEAKKICPTCLSAYGQLIDGIKLQFGQSPSALGDTMFSYQVGELRSAFWGFTLQFPRDWKAEQSASYNPSIRFSAMSLEAPILNPSKLVHGVTIVTRTVPMSGSPSPNPILAGITTKAKSTNIQPLAKSELFAKWLQFDSTEPVGAGDTISGFIAVSKPILNTAWTLAEHQAAAPKEPPTCDWMQSSSSKWRTAIAVSSHLGRIQAPVEITIIYSGSKKSLAIAKAKMTDILTTITLDGRAASAVLP